MGCRHCTAGWHRSRHWNPTFLTVWESLSFDVTAASGVTGVGDVTGSRRGRQHLVRHSTRQSRGSSARGGWQASMPGWGASSR
ncbi:hypothetical protein HYQ46_007866 [Verticillium longisporum]|nr:hypothetical protein HYQ46_007866 [Verticillium longisporum]